ncbi:MAG TPA: Uma2 family endonuclease [Methylomirabilota bacterium]|nr:Uma2 family endonuclease [Methylomirabilota bacterium]
MAGLYDDGMPEYIAHTRRLTRAGYDRLIDAGFFHPDDPIELVGGRLMVAERKTPPHCVATVMVTRAIATAFGPGWDVRPQGPLALDDESEPEPDVVVVPGTIQDYLHEHPSRPVLTVEIAEASLETDRAHKGSLYARAGLADYWVLNLIDRVLEVYREPVPEPEAPFGWRYGRREVLDPSLTVAPLAAPHAAIRVADLLP